LLIVRAYNGKEKWGGHDPYSERLQGVANKFFEDDSTQIGFIGMQETKKFMVDCPVGDIVATGAECFRRIVADTFGKQAQQVRKARLGIIVGNDWKIISSVWLELGKDKWGMATATWKPPFWKRSKRYLLGVRVKHRKTGLKMRFYTLHLSHDSKKKGRQERQRINQLKRFNEYIRSINFQNELPPIIAGDFNLKRNTQPDAYDLLDKYFSLVYREKNDLIAIGKTNKLPGTLPNRLVFHSADVIFLNGLTDHESPKANFTFKQKIRPPAPWLVPK